jgi:predicted ATPase
MLRELAGALEALAAEHPVVLVLEDPHWSDYATLDLVAFLAQRRDPARLLVLGTYRPVEVIVRGHPLKAVVQDLRLRRQCVELRLDGLGAAAVAAYLATRFPQAPWPSGLDTVLHRHTDGHPLFLVTVTDWWVQQGRVAQVEGHWRVPDRVEALAGAVPDSLRTLIESQLEELSTAAQALLKAASVVGEAFSAAAVAAAVEAPVAEVEQQCAALVRRGQFLQASGVDAWPDGTVAESYHFRHALHQQVLYDRLSLGRRLELHRRIGARQEAGYGAHAAQYAAALAVHFARGRDYPRAVHYLQQAAETALRRYAYREAVDHLSRGVALLQTLPETAERARQELTMHMVLGPALTALKGQAAPEVEGAYRRALALCQHLGDDAPLFAVVRGLWGIHLLRGELVQASTYATQCLDHAQRAGDPAQRLHGHEALGVTWFRRGAFAQARVDLEAALALDRTRPQLPRAGSPGLDPIVDCLAYTAWGSGSWAMPTAPCGTARKPAGGRRPWRTR